MEYTNNKIAIDILAAAGCILKDPLSLLQEDESLMGHIEVNFVFGLIIELSHGMNKLLYMLVFLQ